MKTLDAVRLMLSRSGLTAYRVALLLGRDSTYISGMLRRGSVPSADLLARIAAVCVATIFGWCLMLVVTP